MSPDSFSNHAHRALFAAIRALPAPDPDQHAKDTSWLNAVLAAARELTASYLHTLIQVCPWPKHASAYARMVETDRARRTLRAGAERLAQTARDVTLPQPVAILAAADALAARVDDLAARVTPPRLAERYVQRVGFTAAPRRARRLLGLVGHMCRFTSAPAGEHLVLLIRTRLGTGSPPLERR